MRLLSSVSGAHGEAPVFWWWTGSDDGATTAPFTGYRVCTSRCPASERWLSWSRQHPKAGLASFFLGLRGHQVIDRQLRTRNRIEVILPRITTRCFHEKKGKSPLNTISANAANVFDQATTSGALSLLPSGEANLVAAYAAFCRSTNA